MKRQKGTILGISGAERYMLLDALDKRITTLQFRAANRTQIRHDLARLTAELVQLKERIENSPDI